MTIPTSFLSGRTRRGRQAQPRRLLTALFAVPFILAGLVAIAAPAWAAGSVSASGLPGSGFPTWYQDSAGNRVELCVDASDVNCVLPPASDTYDPSQPLLFPSNYPDESFYALASSALVDTPGCGPASPPGRASVRLALEAAFINGPPAGGDQMVFGRIRIKVTSGLCPNTTYLFKQPFATVKLTTNGSGAIPANIGTVDVGCVPTPGVPCDYSLATGSPVLGTAAGGGFLRWNPAVAPAAPAGYLGDGVTLHSITGGSNGNSFEILAADGTATGLATDQFTVAGKLAGPLLASPSAVDFGGVPLNQSIQKSITVTNLDRNTVSFGGNPARLRNGNQAFTVNSTTCRTLVRDATCTVTVSFRPQAPAAASDVIDLSYTGAIRSPLAIPVAGSGVLAGAQPQISLAPAGMSFGDVRLRTAVTKRLTVTNSGSAPLSVTSITTSDAALGADAAQYRILGENCTTEGRSLAIGGTCSADVSFAPFTTGQHPATLTLASNVSSGVTTVALTGNGTGGVAAVSPAVDASDGFPDWYRDENGVKLSQCIDAKDPYCVVLPDATFDPSKNLAFPTNFPGEFFYTVADSDIITTPGCAGSAPGKAFMRSAIEGTFVTGEPVPNEQMVFGRTRIAVTGGLCADTDYTFTTPYGKTVIRTNASGAVPRNKGTEDIGCAPIPPATCDFSLALSAPVLGGALRWDPSVAPAPPAGYLGDAATFHKVVGAPFKEDGVNPSNYFKVTGPGNAVVGQTSQFTVMGKLRGPLEATGGTAVLPATAVGSTSAATTITITNTGAAVGAADGSVTINTATIAGADAAEFAIVNDTCSAAALAVGAACTIAATFSPTQTGNRSATLTLRHTGLNDPFVVPLTGVGQAGNGAAISFEPRSLAFGPLGTGRTSSVETVLVSNAGGASDLVVTAATIGGVQPQYTIVANRCAGVAVPVDGSCGIDVAFTPTAAGTANTTLTVTDNAPGGTHSIPLTGSGFGGAKAVAATLDGNGFARYYQDANGVRLEPCLDSANCVLLPDPTYDPAQPVSFPGNFPGEFFYTVADSELLPLDGCGGTTAAGTALLRVALEGSFVNGQPVPGEQTTFTRIRLFVKSGLCPNVSYDAVTPYGIFSFGTDANGALKRTDGTQDVGCPAAVGTPCAFADALVSPGPAMLTTDTPIEGFLRWDLNVGAPPAGYLGDAASLHKVVGGTYVPPGAAGAFNGFQIRERAGNVVASTDRFIVAGKVAGPLFADTPSVDFGHVDQGQASTTRTVSVTNVGATATSVTASITGADANQFRISGGTCTGAAVTADASCTVTVQFAPTKAGNLTANLTVTPGSGRVLTVPLTGVGDAVGTPAISVTPGVLSYGSVTAPNTATLTTAISNATGTAPLVVSAATISGPDGSDFTRTASTCPDGGTLWTVPIGASCTVSVRFAPPAIGSRTASLTLSHNAAGGSTVVSLTGTGAGSAWSVSPNPVGFGTVKLNSTKTQTLSLKNTGTVPGAITGAATANATPGAAFAVVADPATSTCLNGTAVAPGKTCTLVVTFRPTTAAAYAGDLVITGDGSALPPTTTARLTGTGK